MHIALIIYGNLDIISGGYLYDRRLVAYLRAQGDEVTVISLSGLTYGQQLGHNFSTQLYQRLVKGSFDVLLQDELVHPSLFWLNRRLRGKVSYPIISIVHHLLSCEHHPFWQTWVYRLVELSYLKTLDGFIFNSYTTQQTLENLVNVSLPSVVAYPAGNRFEPAINKAMITKRAKQSGPLRLLFVGNVIARKGLHILLKALTMVSEGDWQLDIVGSLEVEVGYVGLIQQMIETEKLKGHLILHGILSDQTLQTLFLANQLLIVPSSYEGFGIVYLEAMSFGLPAIATTAGATHEIIKHNQNGFLIPPHNSSVLADYINLLIQDRHRLLEMSLAAYEYYQSYPTWKESMSKIRNFLLVNVDSRGKGG